MLTFVTTVEDKFCVKLTDGTERCTTSKKNNNCYYHAVFILSIIHLESDLENLVRAAGNDGNLPSSPWAPLVIEEARSKASKQASKQASIEQSDWNEQAS